MDQLIATIDRCVRSISDRFSKGNPSNAQTALECPRVASGQTVVHPKRKSVQGVVGRVARPPTDHSRSGVLAAELMSGAWRSQPVGLSE